LAKKADKICVAYNNMEAFFEAYKIVLTGNPVRKEICHSTISTSEGRAFFGLDSDKLTIFAVGGSLGSRTINETICSLIPEILEKGYQLIWQTGKNYAVQACEYLYQHPTLHVVAREFFHDMPEAYAAADVIVSRAGAIAVSEIAVVGKPVIYIPSPNVTDDHQTKNAMAMVSEEAALIVKDISAREKLGEVLFGLIENEEQRKKMAINAKLQAKPEAATQIAEKLIELMEKRQNATH
jgi:UDP-N-acetylglucosamine--N-acetylmuramyl-(pentapeptide) pyrophosphoryl-undecaprenol N-acetylglucosamine transferase